jgi:uncharacterized protein (TIGR03083 family)
MEHSVDVPGYLDHLAQDAALLVRAAESAGLDGSVPSCPRWQVRNLLQHLTKVHHWATFVLGGGDRQSFEFERPGDDEVFAVFAAGVLGVTSSLREAPDDLNVWTPAGPSPSARSFWARRMSHETAIHRVDAELAADMGVTEFDADFAADGLDELLMVMAPTRVSVADVPRAFSVTITPLDANAAWTARIGSGGFAATEGAQDGSDLSVFGLASDLYRWTWNRAGDDEVSLRGDLVLADAWRAHISIGAR